MIMTLDFGAQYLDESLEVVTVMKLGAYACPLHQLCCECLESGPGNAELLNSSESKLHVVLHKLTYSEPHCGSCNVFDEPNCLSWRDCNQCLPGCGDKMGRLREVVGNLGGTSRKPIPTNPRRKKPGGD